MSSLKEKIHVLKSLIAGRTQVKKLGDNLIVLGGAPCASWFLDDPEYRSHFQGYDVAFVNYMVFKSENSFFEIKPRYIMMFDPILYRDDYFGPGKENHIKNECMRIFEKVDWECNIVTTANAQFEFSNSNMNCIKISPVSVNYHRFWNNALKKNIFNLGLYNVNQGAVYFAITFGYKNIALLGINYQLTQFRIEKDGMHTWAPMHYYDTQPDEELHTWDVINSYKYGMVADRYKHAYESAKVFWGIGSYAKENDVKVTNYSDFSALDGFGADSIEGYQMNTPEEIVKMCH